MTASAEFWLPRLAPQRWLRGPTRFVPGGVELIRDDANEYELEDGPRALLDLLDVRSTKDMPTFIARHGLLMHGPADRVMRESWGDWETVQRAVIRALGLAMRSAEALTGSRVAMVGLEALLEPLRADPAFRRLIDRPDMATGVATVQAAQIVAATLTAGALGCRLAVAPSGGVKGFRFTVHAETLEQRLWFEAALFVTGRTLLAECSADDCGRVFERDDPRRNYCSDRCSARIRGRGRPNAKPRD